MGKAGAGWGDVLEVSVRGIAVRRPGQRVRNQDHIKNVRGWGTGRGVGVGGEQKGTELFSISFLV